jgi:hypothetical protein
MPPAFPSPGNFSSNGSDEIESLLDAIETSFDPVHAQRLAGKITVQIGDLSFEGSDPVSMLGQHLEHAVHLLVKAPQIDQHDVFGLIGHGQGLSCASVDGRKVG